MDKLQELLDRQPVLLGDGAMGTMLFAAGLEAGSSPELWNVEHPERVMAVHRAYAEAGSNLILSNTFGGNRLRLARHNLGERTAELNRAGAKIARDAVAGIAHPVLIGGDMGPTGEMFAPLGTLEEAEAHDAFAEQAAALQEGGVDYFQVETFGDLREIEAAIQGIRKVSQLPIVATMSFDTRRRTMMGVRPEDAARRLVALGVAAVGSNCGAGLDDTLFTVGQMHQTAPEAVVVSKSNAGLPKHGPGGSVVYEGSPEMMADYALHAQEAGARIIGACCGSSPAHLRAMARALGMMD
jgi:5-methyltetrahydrofolate--homocysteine methyltransferase